VLISKQFKRTVTHISNPVEFIAFKNESAGFFYKCMRHVNCMTKFIITTKPAGIPDLHSLTHSTVKILPGEHS
jgi:hypothetical protein